jgi:hypothetical protein
MPECAVAGIDAGRICHPVKVRGNTSIRDVSEGKLACDWTNDPPLYGTIGRGWVSVAEGVLGIKSRA